MRLDLQVRAKPFFSFFLREREAGERREREGEKHRCERGPSETETSIGCLPYAMTRDQTCNPGMGLDWELNQ